MSSIPPPSSPSQTPESDAPTTSVAVADLAARMDRLPVATRTHKYWTALLGFLFLFDTFDLSAFAYTAPALRAEWNLTIGQISLATSAAFAGMFIGAIVGGRASDRFGRKPVLLTATLIFSTFSLLTAFSPNFETLTVFRFLTGLGLQAMTGVLLVFASEMFPRHLRGRYLAILLAIGISGVPVTALVARLIVPSGPDMWRWVYAIGALGVIGLVVAAKVLPETVRWQTSHGREDQATATVERLEAEAVAATGQPLPEPEPSGPVRQGSVRELIQPVYLKRTVVASGAMIMLILMVYGFNSWVATLLVERGFSQAAALTIVTILAISNVPGALLAYPFVDRVERKTLVMIFAVVASAAVASFGLVENTIVMIIAGCTFTLVQQAIVAVLYTYLPEIYPTHLRGSGAGIANSFGRAAGIAGAFIVGGVFATFGFAAVFLYLAAVAFCLGLILMLFGERTTARPLEQISE